MEIKRTGSNNPAAPAPETGKANATQFTGQPAEAAAAAGQPMDAAFQAIQANFKRADLHTDKWQAILQQSAQALVSKSAGELGGLPDAAQQKIANQIAGDPILSNKIFRYLDQHLA